MADSDRTTTREVEATIIPAGDKAVIPEGTPVTITHKLGGNFTVTCGYGMFRISGRDADGLGEEVPEEHKSAGPKEAHEGPPSEEAIWEKIKTVFDPEIPVNIVDLGLVYSLDISETPESQHHVKMSMTLTAPGCGMGPAIAEDAKNRILEVPGADEASVDIVWDPPWTQDMISEIGKMELGMI